MNDIYVLYNPYAGKKKSDIREKLSRHLTDAEPQFIDMTTLDGYVDFFAATDESDKVIVCGGDGTLNRFANDIDGLTVPCDILYYAAGSGNDFLKDLGRDGGTAPFSIKEYLTDLPVITVNGRTQRFINGVGLGLDGYCCAEVARAKAKGKKTSYVSVAIRAFLKDFSPVNATIIVDGTEYRYEKVWLVPTMKGRFFGGGVMAAPGQDRRDLDVTVLWMHDASRFKALFKFPGFLKGKHVKYKKIVSMYKGRHITVKFDRPTDLQIDGEPFENVSEYTVEC